MSKIRIVNIGFINTKNHIVPFYGEGTHFHKRVVECCDELGLKISGYHPDLNFLYCRRDFEFNSDLDDPFPMKIDKNIKDGMFMSEGGIFDQVSKSDERDWTIKSILEE